MPNLRHRPPTDFISLRAWIANTAPYSSLLDLTAAIFPDVNDFTTVELEEALRYGVDEFRKCCAELGQLRISSRDMTDTPPVSPRLHLTNPGPITSMLPTLDAWEDLIVSAKLVGDLRYQNCLSGLAVGIRRITGEVRRLRNPDRGNPLVGDADEWYAVEEVRAS